MVRGTPIHLLQFLQCEKLFFQESVGMQFSGIEIHLLKMVFEPFLKRKKKKSNSAAALHFSEKVTSIKKKVDATY